MGIDRSDDVAAAVQIQDRAARVGIGCGDPFSFDAVGAHRFALDVAVHRQHCGDLLESGTLLLNRRRFEDWLRLEHLDKGIELLLGHGSYLLGRKTLC
jgi:hypothetical protein